MEVLLSLISGLTIAATVQLLLTNLGIALGLTVLNWSPSEPLPANENESEDDSETSGRSLPITHLVGFGVALTLSSVLFVAALLATEFSQLTDPRRGIIFGLILWSVYWLLFIWLSSTTLSSLANSVLGTAIAGGKRLFNSLRQMWHSPRMKADAPLDEATLVRELVAELSQVKELREQLPTVLEQQREILIQEICDRTDLSPQQAEAVVDDMAATTTGTSTTTLSRPSSGWFSQLNLPSWQQLLQRALNQVDLSDWDAETIWNQAQSLLEASATDAAEDRHDETDSQRSNVADEAELPIVQDAREYVQRSPAWALKPPVIEQNFYQRLHDPDADPTALEVQLSQLDHAAYVNWLQQRGDMATEQVSAIADHLSQAQQSVMAAITETMPASDPDLDVDATPSEWPEFEKKLLAYLRYTNLDLLTADSLVEKIQSIRAEAALSAALQVSTAELAPLTKVLERRRGIASSQREKLTEVLQTQLAMPDAVARERDRLAKLRQIFQATLDTVDWSTVSLEDLKPELLDQMRSLDLRGEIDWQSLVSKLQVPHQTKAELNIWLQEVGQQLVRAPRRWAQRVGHSTQTWTQQLAQDLTDYLQFQDKAALQPSQIADDLQHLLQRGLRALPSPGDWPDTTDLKNLFDVSAVTTALENRRDLTVSEIQQVVGWLEDGWEQGLLRVNEWAEDLWQLTHDRFAAQVKHLDAVREQVVTQVVAAQTAVQTRVAELKADLQRQADAARRQVAIAAWWLFLSLVSSGSAAAIAGWLAVRY